MGDYVGKENKISTKTVVGLIVMLSLIGSIAYVIVKLLQAPEDAAGNALLKSDYILMLAQCILGVIVMLLPSILERHLSLKVPNYMCVMYFIFLYCAIYLGEVRSFYYLIPHWDTILHAFSGAMLGALGFSVVSFFNDNERVKVNLNPIFVALFSFCFAVAIGTLWEIYEFAGDSLLGMNMQKFRDVNGRIFIGQDALRDTMEDIIVDTLSALAVTVVGYMTTKIKIAKLHKTKEPVPESPTLP